MAIPSGAVARWVADSITGKADGDQVDSWPATVGSNPLAQGSAAKRPLFRPASLNGHAAVQFDGVDDMLSATITSTSQPLTVVMVIRPRNNTAQNQYIYGSSPALQMFAHSTAAWALAAGGTTRTGGSVTLAPTVITVVANGASSALYDAGTVAFAADAGPNGLGTLFQTGQFSTGGRYANGDIAEVLIYARALSTAERAAAHSYVQDTYGITVSDYVASTVDLVVNSARAATRASRPALTQATPLTVRGARAATRAGAPQITQAQALTVAGARASTRATAPSLAQATALAVSDARAEARAGRPVLTAAGALAVHDARADTRATTATLEQLQMLTVHAARAPTTATAPLLAEPSPTRDLTLTIGPGTSRTLTATGSSRALTVTPASRTLTASPA